MNENAVNFLKLSYDDINSMRKKRPWGENRENKR